MTTLQEFLNQNIVEGMTKKIPVSERIKDKDGKLFEFEIKSVSQRELRDLRTKYTKINKKGKQEIDSEALNEELVIGCTINPNFKDAASIKATGCVTPSQYLNKVLLPGEIDNINKAILEFSGFGKSIDELVEEVKN